MKKKHLHLFLSISVLAVLMSCNKNEPNLTSKENSKNEQQKPDSPAKSGSEYMCSGHHINRYYKIKDIRIKQDALKKDQTGNYLMTVEFSSNEFYGYRKPEKFVSLFNERAEKFGDLNSKMTFPEPIDYGFAISAYIKNISITSNEAFDAQHPAGASLDDIVKIEYLTPYPCIKNGYHASGLKDLIMPNVDDSDPSYGIQHINKLISQLSQNELPMVYINHSTVGNGLTTQNVAPLYQLRFTKAPSNGVQTITVKITTDEGVYTTTQKVAFL